MEPISALIFACIVATAFVSKKGAAFRDRVGAALGSDRSALRMQERQHEHDRKMARDARLHDRRMAGKAGPTIGESVAERVRRGPKSRADMSGPRAWWFDLCADRADELTRQRRAREERRRNGEQEWQRFGRWFGEWYRRAGERAADRWRERNADRDPERERWTAERLDDFGHDWDRPADGVQDATVVDDPPVRPQPQQIEPVRPASWGEPLRGDTEPQPATGGAGDRTEQVRGPAQSGNVRPGPTWATAERIDQRHPESPSAPIRAVAERIPELSTAAALTEGAPSMGEIFNPETAKMDAEFLSTEMAGIVAHLDARIAEMTSKDIEGVEQYQAMRDRVAGVIPTADEAAETFARHIAKHDALHAGGKPGDGDYMELNGGSSVAYGTTSQPASR